MKLITIKKTCEILNISKATVNNWIKHKYLKFTDDNYFNYDEVIELKDKINKGEINRLNSRANKLSATKTFIPDEYFDDNFDKDVIYQIVKYIKENILDINQSILFLTINLLKSENEITNNQFKRQNIEKIIKEWCGNCNTDFNNILLNSLYFRLLQFKLPKTKDILGIIYQSIANEGNKSKLGSYYTPSSIVTEIVSEYLTQKQFRLPNIKICDPCCGTGQFLLTFCKYIENPENIFGFDIDNIAINTAKINLLLYYKNFTDELNLKCTNSLLENNLNFDLIATNPPYGASYSTDELIKLNNIFKNIKSNESYSYFIMKSIQMLKKNGILSFVLPASILNVKIHKDIREFILKNTKINRINCLGKIFKNVFSDIIRIDLIKDENNKDYNIEINNKYKKYYINQNRFLNNPNFVFDVDLNDDFELVINKIYSKKHILIKGNFDFLLGIVTGDNKKYISSVKLENYEEIYKGSDVDYFYLNEATNYVFFDKKAFQQTAKKEKYQVKEKLIYKFISNKLMFAYDDKKSLTLNSANCLIPKINNYNLKVVAALLNSKVYQFIFKNKFNSIKILKNDIEQLLLPEIDKQTEKKILEIIEKILIDKNYKEYIEILNDIIYKIFDLNNEEIKIIQDNCL